MIKRVFDGGAGVTSGGKSDRSRERPDRFERPDDERERVVDDAGVTAAGKSGAAMVSMSVVLCVGSVE